MANYLNLFHLVEFIIVEKIIPNSYMTSNNQIIILLLLDSESRKENDENDQI
jgi:hypothetical protein